MPQDPLVLSPADARGIARVAASEDDQTVQVSRPWDDAPVEVTVGRAIADQFLLFVADDQVYRLATDAEANTRADEMTRHNLLAVTADELPPLPEFDRIRAAHDEVDEATTSLVESVARARLAVAVLGMEVARVDPESDDYTRAKIARDFPADATDRLRTRYRQALKLADGEAVDAYALLLEAVRDYLGEAEE